MHIRSGDMDGPAEPITTLNFVHAPDWRPYSIFHVNSQLRQESMESFFANATLQIWTQRRDDYYSSYSNRPPVLEANYEAHLIRGSRQFKAFRHWSINGAFAPLTKVKRMALRIMADDPPFYPSSSPISVTFYGYEEFNAEDEGDEHGDEDVEDGQGDDEAVGEDVEDGHEDDEAVDEDDEVGYEGSGYVSEVNGSDEDEPVDGPEAGACLWSAELAVATLPDFQSAINTDPSGDELPRMDAANVAVLHRLEEGLQKSLLKWQADTAGNAQLFDLPVLAQRIANLMLTWHCRLRY